MQTYTLILGVSIRVSNTLWLEIKLVSRVVDQQPLSQLEIRLHPFIFDNLHHIHRRSQSHHSVRLRSQTLRGWTRLGIVPAAPLASDSAHQYWGSFLGCAANALIIPLYHNAVMGYQSCQLWSNKIEDRNSLHHGCGHIVCNCATHNGTLSSNREPQLVFLMFASDRPRRNSP